MGDGGGVSFAGLVQDGVHQQHRGFERHHRLRVCAVQDLGRDQRGPSPPPGVPADPGSVAAAESELSAGEWTATFRSRTGWSTMQNTPNMMAHLPDGVVCPAASATAPSTVHGVESNLTNGRCVLVSLAQIFNDLFWQNRAFHVEIVDANGKPGQRVPRLRTAPVCSLVRTLWPCCRSSRRATRVQWCGAAGEPGTYWDLGVRMDLLSIRTVTR